MEGWNAYSSLPLFLSFKFVLIRQSVTQRVFYCISMHYVVTDKNKLKTQKQWKTGVCAPAFHCDYTDIKQCLLEYHRS